MKKIKLIALFLAVVMMLSAMPFASLTAFAAGGNCGENATWSFDSASGKLTVTGLGDMTDYTDKSKVPWNNYAIKSIEIGEGITSVGNYAFFNCTDAKTVKIPSGVSKIGEFAFDGCSSLTDVQLPDTVESLGNSSFRYSGIVSINIPSSLKTIDAYAFGWCAHLKDVKISEGLESIGEYAFYLCDSLGEITLPSTVKNFGKATFYYCRNLMSIKLPEGINALPEKMFGNCESLKKAELPKSLTAIEAQVFENCAVLTSVNIPSTVTQIGASAFSGCEKLPSVTIPSGVTKFETEVFKNCYLLRDITFPAGITSVEKGAFDGCRNLDDIYYYGTAAMKKNITIATYNTKIKKATWHYVLCETEGHSIRDGWQDDGIHHWYQCIVCEEKFDYGEHIGGTATLTDKAVCEVCGKEYGEKLEFITVSGKITSFGSDTDEILLQFYKKDAAEPAYETKTIGNTVKFELPEIEPGEYTVVVSKSKNVSRKYTVTVVDRNVTFDAEIHVRGDGDGDGEISKKDLASIKNHINGTKLVEGYDFDVLDVTADKVISKKDLVLIKRYLNNTEILN